MLCFENGCHVYLCACLYAFVCVYVMACLCVCVCVCVRSRVRARMDYTHIWTGFHVCEWTRMCLPQHLWTGKNLIPHKDLHRICGERIYRHRSLGIPFSLHHYRPVQFVPGDIGYSSACGYRCLLVCQI